jgi:hypothetical protein
MKVIRRVAWDGCHGQRLKAIAGTGTALEEASGGLR